ncbi:MAG: hypothetical protein CMH62_01830 [Nanoarchaeota archaeon]|nr:hypothetical protein [Nanoarchaeota archaeon]|tara:strand:+ start:3056 stop:3328 length:273 start_codon:yes stop_codon:yes gene_type:complete
MANTNEIQLLLQEWINESKEGSFSNFEEYRNKFGKLEIEIFGIPSRRVINPLAMKYDKARNALVMYSGSRSEKDLQAVLERFSEIENPEE